LESRGVHRLQAAIVILGQKDGLDVDFAIRAFAEFDIQLIRDDNFVVIF